MEALKGVSLDVAEGEKVVVIGPSGSGKSVLIRSINGLERPDSGELTVNGIDMMAKKVDTRKLASEVAMVFQGYNLYPHKTVLENVTFAAIIKVLKVPKAEAEEAGRADLERVGLSSKLATSTADQLYRRPAAARGHRPGRWTCTPKIMSSRRADERPGSGDGQRGARRHQVAGGDEHDHRHGHPRDGLARDAADKVVFMENGLVVDEGTPACLFGPDSNERVQAFLSEIL